ncbi:MAG: phosphodiester glycosidase family protein [Pseudomonadota bacterium]
MAVFQQGRRRFLCVIIALVCATVCGLVFTGPETALLARAQTALVGVADPEPARTPTSNTDIACTDQRWKGASYTVCAFSLTRDTISLFLKGENGDIFATFDRLARSRAARGQMLVFAMNGGMYGRGRLPIGLFVADGQTLKTINTKDGYGNFHLMPNGVFYTERARDGTVRARIKTTPHYMAQPQTPIIATQSGPMLVIDGVLHPRFLPDSTSRKRRNGVGVSADGSTVWFAISNTPVRFHDFATLFRDAIGARDALFLDGEVSKLYAPGLGRHDRGLPMGPILGVTRPVGPTP